MAQLIVAEAECRRRRSLVEAIAGNVVMMNRLILILLM
jgi:hypothetical protein